MTAASRSLAALLALGIACTGQPAAEVKPGPPNASPSTPVAAAPLAAPVATAPIAAPVATAPIAAPVATAPLAAPVATAPLAAPVATAPLATPVVSPLPPAVTPPNVSEPWTTLPDGVVPRALLTDVQIAAADPPILARAVKCDAPKLGGDCNYGAAEILGFDATSVALVYAPESGHPDIWPLVGEVVGLDGKSRARKVITRTGELEGHAYKAARLKGWKWFAAQAKAGYLPPEPLLWALGTAGFDESMHSPLAFLKAPLAGWMLYIAAPIGDEMAVQLVTPDNKVGHRLATLKVEVAERCVIDDDDATTCTKAALDQLDIDAIALDRAGERLVVIYALRSTGGDTHTRRWAIYPLPPAARPQQ